MKCKNCGQNPYEYTDKLENTGYSATGNWKGIPVVPPPVLANPFTPNFLPIVFTEKLFKLSDNNIPCSLRVGDEKFFIHKNDFSSAYELSFEDLYQSDNFGKRISVDINQNPLPELISGLPADACVCANILNIYLNRIAEITPSQWAEMEAAEYFYDTLYYGFYSAVSSLFNALMHTTSIDIKLNKDSAGKFSSVEFPLVNIQSVMTTGDDIVGDVFFLFGSKAETTTPQFATVVLTRNSTTGYMSTLTMNFVDDEVPSETKKIVTNTASIKKDKIFKVPVLTKQQRAVQTITLDPSTAFSYADFQMNGTQIIDNTTRLQNKYFLIPTVKRIKELQDMHGSQDWNICNWPFSSMRFMS
jgi:hypothetical protein